MPYGDYAFYELRNDLLTMTDILTSVFMLGAIALLASLLLFLCKKKFAVASDPRVDDVLDLLPKANCGGCGFAGCQALAENVVAAVDSGAENMPQCPVAGAETMKKIYASLGVECAASQRKVAVVRCAGCDMARIAKYDGLMTCSTVNRCGTGESACGNGCLGCGDCVSACDFGGIRMDAQRHVPVVDESVCVACGSCAKACPRGVIELRQVGPKNRKVYVACNNTDRGPVAMKVCGHSCIGCGKCAKECPFGAIEIVGGVARIDSTKCRLCRKCVAVCPRKSIVAEGFPVRPVVEK